MSEIIKDKIVEAILAVKKFQPGAVLISGKWGVGKTYFWTNSIVPELKRFNRDHLYVSLGSIETPSDFYKKLAFSYVALRFSKMNTGTWVSRGIEIIKFLYRVIKSTLINLPFKLNLGDVSLSYEGAVKLTWGLLDYKEALPNDCVICIDDFERSSLKESDLLTLCLGLQEIKQATIVLICNEERFEEGVFKINKEKLVWKSFNYLPAVDSIYSQFIKDYASEESKKQIEEFKEFVLEPFVKSGKNLRVLARCIKGLDGILKTGNSYVTSEHIKFFCSLYSWSQVKGDLVDIEAYRPETAYAAGRNMLKEEAGEQNNLTEMERESTTFYKQFYTSSLHNGFSEAIYYLVKDGILDEKLFLSEIVPAKLTPLVKYLRELGDAHWYYWNDEEFKKQIDIIVKLIGADEESRFHSVVSLAVNAQRFCSHIDLPLPAEIDQLLIKKCKSRAPYNDEAASVLFSHEPPALAAFARSWLVKYEEEVTLYKAKKIIEDLIQDLQNGENLNTKVIMRDNENYKALKIVLKSQDVLNQVHSIRDTHPESYFVFFTRALSSLQGYPDSNVHEVAELYKNKVNEWQPFDISGSKRKSSLLNVINGIINTRN